MPMRFKVLPRTAYTPHAPSRWLVYVESTTDSLIVEFTDYAEAIRHAQAQSKLQGLTSVEVSDCLGRVVWSRADPDMGGGAASGN